MRILPQQISFKGYDAAPLKKIYIEDEYEHKFESELEDVTKKENIALARIFDNTPWAQDDKIIIENNGVLQLLGDGLMSNNLMYHFEDKYGIQGARKSGFTDGGNTFIGKYPNGEKWILVGEKAGIYGRDEEDISKAYKIKKENVHFLPQQEFHLDMFIRPIGYPYVLVDDPNIAQENIEKFFKDSPEKKELLKKFHEYNEYKKMGWDDCEKTIKKLEEIGFKPIRIGGVYEKGINYINAIVNKHPDGKISYIASSGKSSQAETAKFDEIFEKELREKIPNIDKVYFIKGEKESNGDYYIMNQLRFRAGGLHCMTLEEPDFEAWG